MSFSYPTCLVFLILGKMAKCNIGLVLVACNRADLLCSVGIGFEVDPRQSTVGKIYL